jgi:uncharacterized protein (TIGR02246 family)
MRRGLVPVCIALLTSVAWAQAGAPVKPGAGPQSTSVSADALLKDMFEAKIFEAKIKAEWEALKNKDKKAYAEMLADDYQGVEVDGKGERSKIQAVDELVQQNVFDYTLWGFTVTSLGPDSVLVIYESTIQFPPKAQIRYSRVYISEIWVKRSGQWKELHYQETRVK